MSDQCNIKRNSDVVQISLMIMIGYNMFFKRSIQVYLRNGRGSGRSEHGMLCQALISNNHWRIVLVRIPLAVLQCFISIVTKFSNHISKVCMTVCSMYTNYALELILLQPRAVLVGLKITKTTGCASNLYRTLSKYHWGHL